MPINISWLVGWSVTCLVTWLVDVGGGLASGGVPWLFWFLGVLGLRWWVDWIDGWLVLLVWPGSMMAVYLIM